MAKTNVEKRVRDTRNPFKGMTMAQMKKKYSSMTPAERAANVQTFRDAAKSAPKSKPAPKAKAATKKTTKAKTNSSSSGTRGQFRKVGDPGPNVTVPYGKLDRSGARVRRNQQDARRSRTNKRTKEYEGSNRRNDAAIKAEVDRNSGGSKKTSRSRRAALTMAQRRRARRSSR